MKRLLINSAIVLLLLMLGVDLAALYNLYSKNTTATTVDTETPPSPNNADGPRKDMPPLIPGVNAIGKRDPIIRLYEKDTGDFVCSGTVIASNYAVTAAHCITGLNRRVASILIGLRNGDKTDILATPAFYEGRSDTGLLTGDFSSFNQMPYSINPIFILSAMQNPDISVVACGFPFDGDLFCTQLTERHQRLFGIGARGYLYPGMSGGPVMMIEGDNGALIAVNTSVTESGIYVSPLVALLSHAKVTEAK